MNRRLFALMIATVLLASSCTLIHVTVLADDNMGGRDNATPGSILAQDYLIDIVSFYAEGLNSGASGDDAYRQTIPGGTNILAVIPGTDLADEYVMVGAHYDHVGSNCASGEPGDTICNGATDNAAGVAAVLEIGRILATPGNSPRRSVILAFWDREEDGLLGAGHYVANPLVPIGDTVAYINFDILGANLLPTLRSSSFAVGAETGGGDFVAGVEAAIGTQTLDTRQVSSIFGQNRSDYAVLIGAGVPTVFFSDSTGPCYHTVDDELSVVDFDKLDAQVAIAADLTLQLSSGALTPAFNGAAPLATYADALALDAVVQTALPDLDRFNAADQATITGFAGQLTTMVAEGEANFDAADISILLGGAAQIIGILTNGTCDGFLAPPSGQLDALTYNVAGLPAPLSGSSPDVNTPLIAPLLNQFDLVLLQESWKTPDPNTLAPLRVYHEILEAASTHSFMSVPLDQPVGTDPLRPSAQLSDGLNRFSDAASTPVTRQRWTECVGLVDSASDCLALKGFSHAVLTLAPGVEVDVYNLHAEAGGSAEDERVRAQGIDELVAYIQTHSVGRPLIVGGDFNLHGDDPVDAAVYATFTAGTGLVDACSHLGCPDTDAIDRFFFRSSAGLTIEPTSWQFETGTFVDGGGQPLSDHDPLHVQFDWSVPE
ncbi:MAG: M28 family peptidase [Acidimicrobiales bacterium]